jgi:hypothetical protein
VTRNDRRVLAAIALLGQLSRDLAEEGTPEAARASGRLHDARILCELAAFDLIVPAMCAETLLGSEVEVPF